MSGAAISHCRVCGTKQVKRGQWRRYRHKHRRVALKKNSVEAQLLAIEAAARARKFPARATA